METLIKFTCLASELETTKDEEIEAAAESVDEGDEVAGDLDVRLLRFLDNIG